MSITVDAAIGGFYEQIGELLQAAGHEDASGSRRYVAGLLKEGRFATVAQYLRITEADVAALAGAQGSAEE
jgi:hypothetical protein